MVRVHMVTCLAEMGSQSRYTEYITMPSQPAISIRQLEMTKLYFIAVCAFSNVGRERYLKLMIKYLVFDAPL